MMILLREADSAGDLLTAAVADAAAVRVTDGKAASHADR